MSIIEQKCPKCGVSNDNIKVQISTPISEHYETYECDSCGYCESGLVWLKYILEKKIEIIDDSLIKIYANGYIDNIKKGKELCPDCNSILVKVRYFDISVTNYTYWCNCGYAKSCDDQIPMKQRLKNYNSMKTIKSKWETANTNQHPLEKLKLKYIDELNIINIGILDLENYYG
jgi:hypothetical protein